MTDPRAGDVAVAERLIEQAATDGIAKLPALSAAELWVLCGDQQVLADEAEAQWWTTRSDAEREKYATAMVDFLIHRELIRRPDEPGSTSLPMTAGLAMIVAARQSPAVVVVCTNADGQADQAPRMYGLAQAGQSPRAVVSEVVFPPKQEAFGPMHHFSLVSPQWAGKILTAWATAQEKTGFLSRKPKPSRRVIDVYHHRTGEDLTRDRLVVDPASATCELTRQRADGAPEQPVQPNTEELADLVIGLLLEPAA
ncbi:MAG TPA: DHH family phosphoesterase [Streptosporangiaceae bacterium]|nr:DHH family phosphoesterase [Streptosporangiaceae bacterium]